MSFSLSKHFKNHFGLDLKSTDIDRPDQYSSDLLNVEYAKDGSVQKRKGAKVVGPNAPTLGITTFKRVDPETQDVEEITVGVESSLKRMWKGYIQVRFVGAVSASAQVTQDEATGLFQMILVEDNVVIDTINLGLGFDETDSVTLSELAALIELNANWEANVGSYEIVTPDHATIAQSAAFFNDVSAAYLSIGDAKPCGSSTFVYFDLYNWDDVGDYTGDGFPLHFAARNDTDFEPASFVQRNNVLYIATGSDNLRKFDGQNCYKAGLPDPGTPTLLDHSAGALAAGTYQYMCYYELTDAAGNVINSEWSDIASVVVGASRRVRVTLPSIASFFSSGYLYNQAQVNGNQSGVNTITVTSNSFKVGDKAFFFDGDTNSYVTRNVTNLTTTTITVDGTPVDVTDDAWISCNFKVVVCRSEVDQTTLYEVARVPHSETYYFDNTVDADLGIEVVEPILARALPPVCRYVTTYGNYLVMAGDPENPRNFYWSDVEDIESFPTLFNVGTVQTANGEYISGICQSNEVLAIFEPNATHVATGDFANAQIRIETISHNIGCVAHATIKQFENEIKFLATNGVYQMVSGQIPREQSALIQPLFVQKDAIADDVVLQKKKSLAVYDDVNEKYILFIPTETPATDYSGSATARNVVNENYLIYVQDLAHNTSAADSPFVWTLWRYNNTNPGGGLFIRDNVLWFVERHWSTDDQTETTVGSFQSKTWKSLNLGLDLDYIDHHLPIGWRNKSSWYSWGDPSVFKYVNRLKIYQNLGEISNQTTLTVKTEKDYINEGIVNLIEMPLSDNDGYGLEPYGLAPYGDPENPNPKTKLNGKFKSIRLVFENEELQKNVNISGWELEVAAPFRGEMKE